MKDLVYLTMAITNPSSYNPHLHDEKTFISSCFFLISSYYLGSLFILNILSLLKFCLHFTHKGNT